MKTTFKAFIVLVTLALAACLAAGCSAPAVTAEQYSALQAELKSTQDQLAAAKAELAALKKKPAAVQQDNLAGPRKALAEMQPYLELNMLLLANDETIMLRNSKEITASYAEMQYNEQYAKLDTVLKKFNDPAFVKQVRTAWDDSADTQARVKGWAVTYGTIRTTLQKGFDSLNSQLGR